MTSVSENELLVLKCIWNAGRALSVSEIIDMLQEHYGKVCKHTTVCTFLTRLKNKNYVDYTAKGKSYLYFPLISETAYLENAMRKFKKFWYNDSISSLVAGFCALDSIDDKELKKLKNFVDTL